MKIIFNCPICSSNTSIVLERRSPVPLLQNRMWPNRTSARTAPAGELDIVLCTACGFGWNRAFNPDLIIYDRNYNADQASSPRFREHVESIIGRIIGRLPSGLSTHLVEVGCAQGTFLSQLAKRRAFASLTGFDPAWRGKDGVDADGITVHRQYFGGGGVSFSPSEPLIVVARHLIEHVPDPLSFLRTIRAAMNAAGGTLFLETPDIEWILANFQVHDLFYEHCSIFSRDALTVALSAAGFDTASVEHVFDDQYLFAEAHPSVTETKIASHCNFLSTAEAFVRKRDTFILDWRERLARLATTSRVFLWGAGSKGVTFATLLDPDATRLAGAIDINQEKIGNFMPGTGLPIVSPAILKNDDTAIIMNPNYEAEIAREIRALGIVVNLLDLNGIEYTE